MLYDVFTCDMQTAEKILLVTDKAFLNDHTKDPDLYQFLDMNEEQLRAAYKTGLLCDAEIRNSETRDYIWPNEKGLNLEEALDLI